MTPHPTFPQADALQDVLTRYSDSIDGFRLASDLSTDRAFVRICCHTAELRQVDAEELASMIARSGVEPSLESSTEAKVHRSWIRLMCNAFPGQRARLPGECLRGERDLLQTLEQAIRSHDLPDPHRTILHDMRFEVRIMIDRLKQLQRSDAKSPVRAANPQPV